MLLRNLRSFNHAHVKKLLDMAANDRTPLLGDKPLVYTEDEQDQYASRISSADSQLTALAEELGFRADALSKDSTEIRDKDSSFWRKRNGPVVTVTREQLDELQTALENTSDLLRQVSMNSLEFEALSKQRIGRLINNC